MFDSLLGGKFSNRSKHAIKCIKSRVVPIRKKKQAMLGFLRKDIADLLAHGHDTNAFGRIDELIVDINRTSCYDMIDQYCGCILKQLPNLQKQRECPQEAMEAMSTLIFAAARFPKLPELCDLRRVFTERYGSHMESSVNAEFVEKSQKETFSIEEKLHLMQEIAKEYCINWDSKKFGTKISSPALTSDKPRKSPSMTNGDDELSHKLPNGRHRTAVDVPHEEMPPKERHEPTLRNTMQKLQIEPIDIPVISSVNNGHLRDSSKKTKKFADEPENVKPCYDDTALPFSVKSKDRQNGTHKDDDVNEGFAYDKSSRAQEVRNHKGLEKQTNGSIQSLNDKAAYRVPPYTKSKGSMNGTQAEEQHDDGLAHHRFSRAEEGLDPIGVERRPVRPINMNNDGASKLIPPYVKPKVSSVADPIDLFNQVNTSNQVPAGAGYGMSNGRKDNLRDDLFGDDGKPKPRSMKSKYTKVPVVDDVDAIDGDKLLNGIPGSRRTGGRQITGNQIDDYTEQKIMGQRSRARASVEVDNVIDYGKLLIQTPRGRRGQRGSRQNAAAYDGDCEEEEKIMDHLLTHYSKKGLPCRPSKAMTMTRTPTEQVFSGVEVSEHQRNNKHDPCPRGTVYQRAVSLPPEPISLAEVVKGPARATSMQPDLLSPNMGRVHPRLPDYDELASRLIALRKA